MKALVKVADGRGGIEFRHVPRPTPRSGEVLIRVDAVGICGTDLHIINGEYPCRPPVIPGHEFAGTISEVGTNVLGWSVGDRVTCWPYASFCGRCRFCLEGEPVLCGSRLSYGSDVNGAYAEYISVGASGIFRLPERIDVFGGCLIEPLACVSKAVLETGSVVGDERVAVIGPGPIGLLATQVARAAGARVSLFGLRSDEDRLALGQSLGAERVICAEDCVPNGNMLGPEVAEFDTVFECSGSQKGLKLAIDLVRKKGQVIQVALFGEPIDLAVDELVLKNISFSGSMASSRRSWESALSLASSGGVDMVRLVSDVFPLEQGDAAFERARSKKGLKVVFAPRS